MRRIFTSLLVIFCSISFAFSQTKPSKIVGAYQWCPFHCENFKLNADFTFDSLLEGDLYGETRTKGTWKFIEKNKIYLKPDKEPLEVKVEEKSDGQPDKIKIQTLDQAGAVFSNIEIIANQKHYITDANGYCEIPKTEQIKVLYQNQNRLYQIKDKNTSELLITIEIGSSIFARSETIFIIKQKEICLVGDNPNDLTCFRKLKKATELKLFPSNSK